MPKVTVYEYAQILSMLRIMQAEKWFFDKFRFVEAIATLDHV